MNREKLEALLREVESGRKPVAAALEQLAGFPEHSIEFARIDTQRELRQGRPEVVYSEGKTVEQLLAIASQSVAAGSGFIATRTSEAQREALVELDRTIQVDSLSRVAWRLGVEARVATPDDPLVLVVAAGTSDLPVAAEAANTLLAWGRRVEQLNDVGVAGLHRLLSKEGRIRAAAVVIVVAGMEGALASVVGGLVAVPVIAVPTSVGYGASFGGIAALLAMLNSCAAGVTVTNIDNGFGAAAAADRHLARPGSQGDP